MPTAEADEIRRLTAEAQAKLAAGGSPLPSSAAVDELKKTLDEHFHCVGVTESKPTQPAKPTKAPQPVVEEEDTAPWKAVEAKNVADAAKSLDGDGDEDDDIQKILAQLNG